MLQSGVAASLTHFANGGVVDYQSAIVILAPHRVQAFAVPLMRRYCLESSQRVPAHITVLYPFAPPDELDDICPTLREIFAAIPPFEVTLDGYGHFPTTTYLKPANPQPIKALFQAVHAAFPGYPPYRGLHGADDITPHMTVGEFTTEAERDAADYPPYDPLTFPVRRLHLMVGVDHVPIPWITRAVFSLKGAR